MKLSKEAIEDINSLKREMSNRNYWAGVLEEAESRARLTDDYQQVQIATEELIFSGEAIATVAEALIYTLTERF